MGKFIDLTGQKFGRLVVIECVGRDKHKHILWKCVCNCPNGEKTECIVDGGHLRTGHTRSCGCLHDELVTLRNLKHGKYHCRLHIKWNGIKNRCYNPNSQNYEDYGGRGITVCDEWQEFEPFYEWAMANGYDENAPSSEYTIERIDVNGDYEPSNCRWATDKEQANNRRNNHFITYNGKTKTLSQWEDELGIKQSTLKCRINNYNWSIERALTEKPFKGKNQYSKKTP